MLWLLFCLPLIFDGQKEIIQTLEIKKERCGKNISYKNINSKATNNGEWHKQNTEPVIETLMFHIYCASTQK